MSGGDNWEHSWVLKLQQSHNMSMEYEKGQMYNVSRFSAL